MAIRAQWEGQGPRRPRREARSWLRWPLQRGNFERARASARHGGRSSGPARAGAAAGEAGLRAGCGLLDCSLAAAPRPVSRFPWLRGAGLDGLFGKLRRLRHLRPPGRRAGRGRRSSRDGFVPLPRIPARDGLEIELFEVVAAPADAAAARPAAVTPPPEPPPPESTAARPGRLDAHPASARPAALPAKRPATAAPPAPRPAAAGRLGRAFRAGRGSGSRRGVGLRARLGGLGVHAGALRLGGVLLALAFAGAEPARAQVTIGVEASFAEVQEGGSAFFRITLGGDARTGNVTVNGTLTGTAEAGVDYTGEANISRNIRDTQAFSTVTRSLTADMVEEGDETIIFTVTSITGADGNPLSPAPDLSGASAMATIAANDPVRPSVMATPERVQESAGSITFRVNLGGGMRTGMVRVNWALTGTAAAGVDYGGADSGGVNIAAAAVRGDVTLALTDDMLEEGDETIIFTVSGITGLSNDMPDLSSPSATAIIAANDPVEVSVAAMPERVQEGAGSVTFRVTLGGGTRTGRTTVNWALTGTAAAGVDYGGGASGSLDIAAGDASGDVMLSLTDDALEEDDETIIFTVSQVTGPNQAPDLSSASATATIAASDVILLVPQLRIAAPSPSRLNEGMAARFIVTLQNPPAQDVTVNWNVGEDQDSGTADAELRAGSFNNYRSDFHFNLRPRDIPAAYGGTLTFRHALNERRKTIEIELRQDREPTSRANESAEEFYDVILSAPMPSNIRLARPRATGSIVDGGQAQVVDWNVIVSIADAMDTVSYGSSGRTAQTTTVQEGATVDVKFVITRASSTGSVLPSLPGLRGDVIYTICIPHLGGRNFGVGRVVAGAADSAQAADIRVSGAHVVGVMSDSCATLGGGFLVPGTKVDVRIPANMSGEAGSFTIQIHTLVDGSAEAAETIMIAQDGVKSNPASVDTFFSDIDKLPSTYSRTVSGFGRPIFFTIAANTGSPARTLSLSGPLRASEGAALAYTPGLTGMQFSSATQINWAISGSGSAPASGADFTATSGSFMWPANSSTAPTFTITSVTDALNEPDEEFTVSLAVPGAGAVGSAIAPITTTLEASNPITIRAADAPLAAEGGIATFQLTLGGGERSGALLVGWAVTGIGTTSAADFGSAFPASRLSIPADANNPVLRVPIATDSDDDDNEQFTLTLQSAESVKGGDAEAWNSGPVNFQRRAATGIIGAGGDMVNRAPVAVGSIVPLQFVTGQPQSTSSVSAFFMDPDGDTLTYTAVSSAPAVATASIAGASLTVTAVAAGAAEVTVGAADPGGLQTSQIVQVRVRDSARITIAPAAGAMGTAEGGNAEFIVSVANFVPPADLMVAYSVAATTASDDDDAEAADFGSGGSSYPSGSVTIPASQVSVPLRLAIFDDTFTEPLESYSVTLGRITPGAGDSEAYTLGTASSAVGTIAANDPARTLSITGGDSAASEGGMATYTATLGTETPHTGPVTLNWAVMASAATGDDDAEAEDFCAPGPGGAALTSLPSGTLSFAPGVTEQAITLNICDDSTPELAEIYDLQLSSLDDGMGNPASTMFSGGGSTLSLLDRSIALSDPVQVSLGDAEVVEGGTAELPLTFSGERPASATIALAFQVRTGDSSAAAADYTAPTSPQSLSVTTSSSHNIQIATTENTTPQMSRTVALRLTATGHSLFVLAGADENAPERNGTLTISDDDPVRFGFARKAGEMGGIAESPGAGEAAAASFTVRRASNSATPVSNVVVQFSVGGDGITAGDYDITAPAGIAPADTSGSLTFSTSQTSMEITITASDDALLEGLETLVVTLDSIGGGGGMALAAVTGLQVGITDNEAGSAAIAREDSGAFTEGGAGGAESAEFRITISGAELGRPAMVDFLVTGCGSGDAADCSVSPSSGVLQIDPAPGMTMAFATITIVASDDTLNEAPETIRVSIGGVRPAGLVALPDAAPAASVSLEDDDGIRVKIEDASTDSDSDSPGAQVNEGETAQFLVTLLGAASGSAAAVTVPYTIGGDVTASDYIDEAELSLVIPAGMLSGTIRILIRQDGAAESSAETLRVTLGSNPSAAAGGGSVAQSSTPSEQSAEVQIPMSAAAPRNFSVAVDTGSGKTTDRDNVASGVQVNEGDSVFFSVSLAGTAPTENATIEWRIRGVEADDYTLLGGVSSPLTFTPDNWQTAQAISAMVTDDALNEGAEVLSLRLIIATGGSGVTVQSAEVEIAASDPINYAIGPDVTTGETAGGMAAFRVTLSGASSGSEGGAVRVPIALAASSTATAMEDYSGLPSELVFGAEGVVEMQKDISIAIAGDMLNESAETVVIELGAPTTGAGGGVFTAGRASATLTITDDDALAITVAGPDAEVAEGGAAVFTISVAGGVPSVDMSMAYTLEGAGITPADIDGHIMLSGVFTITRSAVENLPAGQVSLSISIADDVAPEDAETLTLIPGSITPAAGGGAATASGQASATISASDPLTLDIARQDTDGFSEGGSGAAGTAVFRVTVTGGIAQVDLFAPFLVGGTRVTAGDYALLESGSVIASANGGTLTIASGASYGEFTLSALADDLNEAAETLQVTLQTPRSAGALFTPSLGTARANAVIPENEPAVISLSVVTSSINEGQAAVFRANLDVPSAGDITWGYFANITGQRNSGAANSAQNPDLVDGGTTFFGHQLFNQTVRIPAGMRSADFRIATAVDGLAETAETLRVRLDASGTRNNSIGAGSGAVTVNRTHRDATIRTNSAIARSFTASVGSSTTDRDSAAGGVQVDEGDTVAFQVSLIGPMDSVAPTEDATINYAISGGQSGDWSGTATGTLTFTAADHAAKTVSITITEDSLNEGAETLTMTLSSPMGGGGMGSGLAESRAVVEIRPSDPLALSIARTNPAAAVMGASIPEGGSATFQVRLSAASSVNVPFTWGAEIDAQANTGQQNNMNAPDLSASSATPTVRGGLRGMGTITAGQTTRDIVITAAEDGIAEADETFTVTLRAPSVAVGAAPIALGTPQSASVGIDASSVASRVFTLQGPGDVDPSNVNEGSMAQFSIARTGPPLAAGETLQINWSAAAATGDGVNPAEVAEDLSAATGSVTFASGDASKSFSITASADTLNEGTEAFTVSIASTGTVTGSYRLSGAGTTTTITDDPADDITATLSGGGNVAEGANAVVTVQLSGGTLTEDLVLNYATGADNDDDTRNASASDFSDGGGGVFTIAPGDSAPHTFNIATTDDALNEPPEVFTVSSSTASSAGQASVSGSPQVFTITDGDPITVSIAAPSPATVDEGSSASFTITLAGASAGSVADIEVGYTATGTTDTPTDANSGSITISAGSTEGTITLGIPLNAALDSSSMSETLNVNLGTIGATGGGMVSAAASPGDSAAVTVRYLAAAHTFSFSNPATNIAEGDSATYTVRRSGRDIAVGNDIVVRWTYAAGTANPAAATDFSGDTAPAGGEFTFTGSQTSKTFTITTKEDTDSEPDETFTLGLTAQPAVLTSNGGVELPADISVTIGASDQQITVSITAPDDDLAEGAAANFSVGFGEMVTTTEAVTVDWEISYPAAAPAVLPAADADFATRSGTARIIAGERSANLPITATADNLNEAAERFIVTISNAAGGGAIAAPVLHATPRATANIAASNAISVRIARAGGTAATVDEGGTAAFTVTLDGASAGSAAGITVNYTLNNISVTPTDANSGRITIAAGDTEGTIILVIPLSTAFGSSSPDETLRVTLGNIEVGAGGGAAAAAASPGNSASVMVNYVDAAHIISFDSPAMSISEGAAATTYTVSRTGPDIIGTNIAVRWTYAVAATNPAAATDFTGDTAPAGGELTFTGSQTSATFTIATKDDSLNEAGEGFTLGLSATPEVLASEGGVALGNAVAVTIADDDSITATLSGGGNVAEGADATVNIQLSGGMATADVVLNYTIGGTPAGDDVDAVAADYDDSTDGGSITIAMGATNGTITIGIADDDLNEAGEKLSVSIGDSAASSAGAVTTSGSPQTFTLTDGDPISVSIAISSADADSVASGVQVEEGGNALFTVTLSKASAAEVTIPYSIGGDVVAADYTDAGSGSLRIPAGEETGTISIALEEDADTASENLVVTLGNMAGEYAAAGSIARSTTASEQSATAVVTTRSSVRTLTLTAASQHPERNLDTSHTFNINFSAGDRPFDSNTQVTWTITHGTTNGTEAADFAAVMSSVNILAGSTAQVTFDITIRGDDLNEASENFSVNLTAPDSLTDIGAAVMLTITDDDAITYSISSGGAVAESAGNASFTVSLSGPSEGAVTLPFTLGGSATGGAASEMGRDYTNPATSSVTVAAGVRMAALRIAIHDDNLNEAGEAIIVTLSSTPTLGDGAGAVTLTATPAMQSATAAISDDDALRAAITTTTSQTKEGATAQFFVAIDGENQLTPAYNAYPVEVVYSISGTGISSTDYADDTQHSVKTASGGTLTFPAMTRSRTIRLRILSDNLAEGVEDLIVTLTSASSPMGGAVSVHSAMASAESRIPANAQFAHAVAVEGPANQVREPGNAAFTLRVTQDSGSASARDGDATVAYTIGGTAASGMDFTAPSGMVSIAEDDDSVDVSIPITSDNLNEGAETIILTLGSITGAATGNLGPAPTLADRSATATIEAGDQVTLRIVRMHESVNEGSHAEFRVLVSESRLSEELTLPYAITGVEAADVTADADSGLVAGTLGGTLRIAGGGSVINQGSIRLNAVADNLNEAAETLTLQVLCSAPSTAGPIRITGCPVDGSGSIANLTSTIAASDPITLSIASPTATSEGSDAVFSITISGATAGSEGAITLPYSVAAFPQSNSDGANTDTAPDITGGTADGALSGQMLEIPAGETTAEIRIPLHQDGLAEGEETFRVTLGTISKDASAGAVTIAAGAASATIPANAAFTRFLAVTINDAASASVAEGGGAQFDVALSGAEPESGSPATVTWTLSGTAVAEDHACDGTGTLTFSAVGTQSITCAITMDGLNEAAESLIFTLSNPASGSDGSAGIRSAADGMATANIPASDPITYSISGPASMLAEDAAAAVFTVRISGSSAGAVTIPYQVDLTGSAVASGGLAGDNTRDYTTPSALSVSIAARQMTAGISISLHNDMLNEASETITLVLLPDTDAGFSKDAAAGAVTRTAVESAQRASARITDDAADTLVLGIARAAETGAQVLEGQSAFFDVRIASAPTSPTSTAVVCVPYSINIGVGGITGGIGGDYTDNTPRAAPGATCAGMASIPAGASMVRISLTVDPDGTEESAETLRVTLGVPSSPGGGSVRVGASASASVTIPANAAAAHIVSAAAATPQVQEGTAAAFHLQVVDSGITRTQPIEVTYEIAAASTASAADYTAPSGMISIAPSQMRITISIPTVDDTLNEGAETLALRLLTATGGSVSQSGVGTASATVTLAASDPITAELARSDSGDLVEGGTGGAESAVLRVTLRGGELSAAATLPWRITGGVAPSDIRASANAGHVVGSLGGVLTIMPGESSGDITLTAVADNLNEAAEMLTLTLRDESGAAPNSAGAIAVSSGAASAALRIAASDPVTLGIAAPNPASVREGQVVEFQVTLSGASAGSAAALTVPWSARITTQRNPGVAPDTVGDPDYAFLPAAGAAVRANAAGVLPEQRLVISRGQTSAVIRIEALFDNLDEGSENEPLELTLLAPTAGAGGGAATLGVAAVRSAVVQIVNVNALRTLSVAAPDPVAEGENIVFEVALEGMAPQVEISVPWTLAPGSATGPPLAAGLARSLGRNHGGAHPDDPDFGTPSVSNGRVTGLSTGMLVFPAGALSVQSVTVPTRQDPLNEGRESLHLNLGPVPESAGGGGTETIPATQVVAGSAPAEIEPSDPIMTRISRASSALADGGQAIYRVSFGTTEIDGEEVPIIATTPVRVSYTWSINGDSMSSMVTLPRGVSEGMISVPVAATTGVANTGVVELTVNLGEVKPLNPDGTPLPPDGAPPMVNPDSRPIVVQIGDWSVDLSPEGGQVFEGGAITLTATLNGDSNLDAALTIRWMLSASGSGLAQAEPEDFADESGAALDASSGFPSGSIAFAAGDAPGSTRSFMIRVRNDGIPDEAGMADEPERFRVALLAVAASRNVSVDTQPAEFTIPARQSAALVTRRSARIRTLLALLDRDSALLATDVISARLGRSPAPLPWESLSVAGRELLRQGAGEEPPQSASAAAAGGAPGAAFGAAPADGLGLALYGAAGRGGAKGGLAAANLPGVAGVGGAAFGGLGAGLSQDANLWQGSALPSLAELLNGSGFSARSNVILPHWTGVTGFVVWGAGGATQLEGEPLRGGRTLTYKGENYAGFVGVESRLGSSMLAGVALGYSSGDLDFSESASAGANDTAMRGTIENERMSVHPYWGWWLTPNLQTWMVLGYGTGNAVIEEREGPVGAEINRRAKGGSAMWMASGGATGMIHLGSALDLALRLRATRVHSELDAARFADIVAGVASAGGALLPKLRTRSLRAAGEAEFSTLLSLGGDLSLRPFASAEVHLDAGSAVARTDSNDRETAFDLGGGLVIIWPSRGFDMRLEGATQVNDTGHEQRRLSLDLGYDRGADARGFTLSLRSALAAQRAQQAQYAGWPGATPQIGQIGQGATGSASAAAGFGAGGRLDAAQRSLSGELAYGAALQQFGRSGLLTPYAAFSLGSRQRRYATGLRFQTPGGLSVHLEGAAEAAPAASPASSAPTPNYELRFDINLPF